MQESVMILQNLKDKHMKLILENVISTMVEFR